MTAEQSTIMTVAQIAVELGCRVQTVRLRIKEEADRIPMF
jgi:predicted transcriptional regulator